MSVDEDNPSARRPIWQRHARALLIGVLGSLMLVFGLRGVVGRGDVLAALLASHDGALVLAFVVSFTARAFLIFMAPGWALYVAVLLAHHRHARAARPPGPQTAP
jgi:Na+-translocating ferredoxin:NAD+ oxidoreductase RnfE subunit